MQVVSVNFRCPDTLSINATKLAKARHHPNDSRHANLTKAEWRSSSDPNSLVSEYDVPDDVFMALELSSGALRGYTGTIRYHSAFGTV